MKRFAIIFNGIHWSIPKWYLRDREKLRWAYFSDYALAKLVRQFYEDHPELEIPEFPSDYAPLIRDVWDHFVAINGTYLLEDVHVTWDNFHTLMISYAEKAKELEKSPSVLLPRLSIE